MKTASSEYVPGVCNIGPAEIAKRRLVGWIGLIVAAILLVLLIGLKAPVATRLLVFFPVAIASSGFLQAYLHFCAGFGTRGLYNFSKVGKTNSVENAEFRIKDRRKSMQILGASVVIGLVIAVICVLV